MTSPAAFQGTYADWKLVKTRGVVQVVIEVPLADADAAYEVLGGMPVAGKERWFAVAALKDQQSSPSAVAKPDPVDQPRPDRAKRDWRDLPPSQQAALRCQEASFWAFLREEQRMICVSTDGAANAVRTICGVDSRSELDRKESHGHRVIWHQLDSQYQAWLAKERVGA